jgi:hypothetical protein
MGIRLDPFESMEAITERFGRAIQQLRGVTKVFRLPVSPQPQSEVPRLPNNISEWDSGMVSDLLVTYRQWSAYFNERMTVELTVLTATEEKRDAIVGACVAAYKRDGVATATDLAKAVKAAPAVLDVVEAFLQQSALVKHLAKECTRLSKDTAILSRIIEVRKSEFGKGWGVNPANDDEDDGE